MYRILFTLYGVLICAGNHLHSQYSIDGITPAPDGTKIYLKEVWSLDGWNNTLDSAIVDNQHFLFTGNLKQAGYYTLSVDQEKGYLRFFLGDSHYQVSFKSDSVWKGSLISDNPEFLIDREFSASLKAKINQSNPTSRMVTLASRQGDSMQAAKNKLRNAEFSRAKDSLCLSLVSKYPNSIVALHAFPLFSKNLSTQEKKLAFDQFSRELNDHPYYHYIGRTLYHLDSIFTLGEVAPDLYLNDIDSPNQSIRDYQEYWVLLNYWTGECKLCQADYPNLSNLKPDVLKTIHIESYGLARNATDAKERSYFDHWSSILHSMQFSRNKSLMDQIPFTVLLSPGNKIIGVNLTPKEIEKTLREQGVL